MEAVRGSLVQKPGDKYQEITLILINISDTYSGCFEYTEAFWVTGLWAFMLGEKVRRDLPLVS